VKSFLNGLKPAKATLPSSGALTSRARSRHVLLIRRTAPPETSSGWHRAKAVVETFFSCVLPAVQLSVKVPH